MSKFKYVAMDIKGNETEGVVDASSLSEAVALIRAKGLFPTRVNDLNEQVKTVRIVKPTSQTPFGCLGMSTPVANYSKFGFGRITTSKLSAFARKLSCLMDSGLPLLRCLRILKRQEKNSKFAKILDGISEAVEGGSTFSEALSMYPKTFNATFVNMVKAGEAGGVLEVTTSRLADYLDKDMEVKNNVGTSFLVFVMSAIVLSVLASIIGTLWLLNPFVVGAIAFLVMAVDIIRMYASLNHSINIASFSRILGTCLNSGIPVLQALNITRDTCKSSYYKEVIQLVHDSVKEGDTISAPLEAGKFPSIVVGMIDVGEETGALPEMLYKIAELYDKDIDNQLSRISRVNHIIMSVAVAVVAIISIAK